MTNTMPAQLSPEESADSLIESVIVKGDLAKLTSEERTKYYVALCKFAGLNPLSRPFAYINMNGRLVLYALRACTDQLRLNRGVSVEDVSEIERDGIYIVTCKVRDRDSRTDVAKGAVSVAGLRGENLANAIMKAETKAKRRATLSICGLGMLDEGETEALPERPREVSRPAAPLPAYDPETGEIWEHTAPHTIDRTEATGGGTNWVQWGTAFVAHITHAETEAELEAWILENSHWLDACEREMPKVYERLQRQMRAARERLQPDLIDAGSA